MARNDVQVIKGHGPVRSYKTEAGATDILRGEPVKVGGTGNNFVIPLATGDPEISTDEFVGIAAENSSHTASANGDMLVQTVIPGRTVLRWNAETSGNLADGLLNDYVTCDLSSSTYTLNEDEGKQKHRAFARVCALDKSFLNTGEPLTV